MKKNLLLLLLISQICFAQQLKVQSIVAFGGAESAGLFHPVFSPDGKYVLATSENFTGLKQLLLSDRSVKVISTDKGAGYGVQISTDGNTIVYKKTDLINNLRHTSVYSYVRSTGAKNQLVTPTREAITTQFSGNKPQFVKGKMLIRTNITAAELSPVICIEDQKMVIYTGSKRSVLTPNGQNASYIWPSISPDKKNIVYTVATKGTYVCGIDGSNPKSLGKLNAPVWLNNQWVVGMDDKDDGEKLLSSTLVAIPINGKVRQIVQTPANKMAMYPAASADGTRIVFSTEKGELYLLNIQVK